MMTMILDGYNVIYAVPELARQMDRSLQASREALVQWCQEYRARRGDIGRFYVVFDGRDAVGFGAREQTHGRITVIFTQKPEEADTRILALIEAQGGRVRCVVVSNDNEVFNNARAFGASVMSVQAFAKKARRVGTTHLRAASSDRKEPLSARDAQQITGEYRQHLDAGGRGT